jgi:hypothetical protein
MFRKFISRLFAKKVPASKVAGAGLYQLRNGMIVKVKDTSWPKVFCTTSYERLYHWDRGEIVYLRSTQRKSPTDVGDPLMWVGGAFGRDYDVVKKVSK